MINRQEFRYLVGGAWNTVFGYGVALVLYRLLGAYLPTAGISLIASVVAISMAFLTYKLFVFRTRGNWLREYFRSYLVYGVSAIAGIACMMVLVDHMHVQFWLAQALVMAGIVVFSFFAHRLFTFGPTGK
jgi:putative flippase GtrA